MSAVEIESRSERLGRCAVLASAKQFASRSAPVFAPQGTQVRVQLEGSGVCASNLPVWEGREWFQYPLEAGAPGHEGWGIVEAIGERVTKVNVGQRVALISGHAYSQFDVADESALVVLPDPLRDKPFPGEPLGCAMNIFERSDIATGQRVAIVGAGFLGLLLTQLCAHRGAEVAVFSRREFALQLAREMGARQTWTTADSWKTSQEAWEWTGGRGFDRVIEIVGEQSALDLATALIGEYGKLIIAGYHQDGLRQVNMQTWNWRAIDVINAHERELQRYVQGMQRAVAAILAGTLQPFALLTHEVTLDRLNDAFELMRSRPEGFIKAVVRV